MNRKKNEKRAIIYPKLEGIVSIASTPDGCDTTITFPTVFVNDDWIRHTVDKFGGSPIKEKIAVSPSRYGGR